MTNIIQFPKNSTNPHGLELNSPDLLVEVRKEFCDEVVSDALDAIVAVFASYGIVSRGDVASIKDIVFLEESLKALTYRHKNLEHSLHEIIDHTITISPELEKQIEEKYTQKDLT